MPFFRIVPPEKQGKEMRLESVSPVNRRLTDDEIRAESLRRHVEDRQGESYSTLRAKPTSSEGRYGPPNPEEDEVITEETRKHLEKADQEKASVPNVVTTHSDLAKVAAGSDIGIVRTVDVYTKDNPLEGDKVLRTEDRTVALSGVAQGDTVIDRADTSIPQPEGDEYSAKSATGPTLPEGQVLSSEGEVEKVFDPEDSSKDRLEKSQAAAEEAGETSARVVEKTSKAPKTASLSKGAKGKGK